MADIKVPNQYTSGDDTFSDNLVGFQIVDGSSQMTATSFSIDRVIPEKDSKNFQTKPFSDFITLDTINEEDTEVESTSTQVVTQSPEKLKFYNSKNDGTKSLFGSLRKRLSVTVQNIILKYPAAIYVDKYSPIKSKNYVAWDITYSSKTNSTTFSTQKSVFFNPLDIVLSKPEGKIKPQTTNHIRNLYSTYKKYVVDISGVTYNVVNYTQPDSNNTIIFEVEGDCFGAKYVDLAGYNNSFLIRPNDGIVEEFYKNLDELEIVLMDRETDPQFQGKFRVPKDINQGESTKLVTQIATWPVSKDEWNVQIVGIDFDSYLKKLSSIGDEVDNYKSNLIVRFLTAPQLFEFDTEDQKAEAMFQIYGQSFDKVKKFIDNIAYMRNVTYDKINNVPDLLLKNLAVTLGLSTVGLFDENTFQDALYTRTDTQYIGLNLGKNLIEAEYEFYRRILVNLAHVYKSKGTRQAIEFFLKFIGAPEPMIRFDEYIYRLDGPLPKATYEDDIRKAILGTYVSYSAVYTGSTIEPTNDYGVTEPTTMSQYVISGTTGSTTFTRDEYPVDPTTGLPRGIETSDGGVFFQLGAGWYRKTIDHRSHDILDTDRSVLTGRTKIIKTKSKPFTYGEDYFDYFRTLPGLDYGYDLIPDIDNKKTEIVVTEEESRYTLNRKNISIFLSADRAIDYDIYTKSRNQLLTFGTLAPPTGMTFAEFLTEVLNEIITNSNVIRYKRYYQSLDIVYNEYKNNTNFTPYNYIKVNEFIDRMSPYWTQIIDQFVPATTLWLGGNVVENGALNRSKFWYKKPCVPVELIENLYPDFCGIFEEDLETIIGGGTIKGEDVAEDYLRELFTFSGFTYTLYIDVNGHLFTGTTELIIEEVLSGFTPTADCTSLVETTTSVPLICEFKDWVFCDLEAIKVKWLSAIQDLVDNINANSTTTGVSITYEIFTDTDGVDKIRFYILNEECIEGDDIDFYFEPSYVVPRTECDLRVEISTPDVFYAAGETVPCADCDPAYTWIQEDENTCVRFEYTGATAPSAPIGLTARPYSTYSTFGTKLFDADFNLDSTGTYTHLTDTSLSYVWKNNGGGGGPLNRCALWTKSPLYDEPRKEWLGFGVCLSGLTERKTHYVGVAGDNFYRLVLNGTTIVDSSLLLPVVSDHQFKYWHIYPIDVGPNDTLEVFGMNWSAPAAGFGCEIYDNTYDEITGATIVGDVNIVFTTSGLIEAQIVQTLGGEYISSGYTCPSGFDPPFVYEACSGTCVQRIECISSGVSSFDIDNCQLTADLYLKIINDNYDGNGGFVAGIEQQNPEPINIYVTTGTTCDELVQCNDCEGSGWLPYNEEYCYKITLTGGTPPASPVTLGAETDKTYSKYGTKLFNNGFELDGSGTPSDLLVGTDVWHNQTPNTTDGPLNRCALWDTPSSEYTWFGFGKCLSGVTETKTYYVGIAGDNHYKLLLDQELIVDTSDTAGSTEKFNYWHIYPVDIGAGDHTIYLFGYNNYNPAGFGCEIYDNTYEDIKNATTYGDLNVLFTSSGVTEATFVQDQYGNYTSAGYVCPDGYTYSDCAATCVQVLYCESSTGSTNPATICTNCDFDEASFEPIETTASGCTYLISGASETNIYDIIIGDAANCERKFRIEGLSPHIDQMGISSGYTVYPKVQYKTTDNFGLKKGTVVYREINEVPLVVWENLSAAISNGDIEEIEIESVGIGDVLISVNPKDSSEFSIIDIQNALDSNGSFDFTFDYNRVEILNIECLSSIKKNIINDEFVLLPTSKVFVYSNINPSLEKVPFHFTFKYPEDLYIASTGTTEEPCCPYPDNDDDISDRLINQYGFLIEVSSVNLNYCEGGIYYRVDYKNAISTIQRYSEPSSEPTEYVRLLNGAGTGTTRLIVAHEKIAFECLNMNLQHYFVNSNCSTVPSIEDLERNPCGLPDCEPIDCNFDAEIESTSDCLAATTFIVQYNTTLGPCWGGHNCNCATFNLIANEVNLGTVYLSNSDGSNDIHNYPPGETSGQNRYNQIMMSPEQAEEISSTAIDGIVDFSLECILPIGGEGCDMYPTGCHEDVTWITMIRDGVTIYEGCPEGNFISMNPCTGEIIE